MRTQSDWLITSEEHVGQRLINFLKKEKIPHPYLDFLFGELCDEPWLFFQFYTSSQVASSYSCWGKKKQSEKNKDKQRKIKIVFNVTFYSLCTLNQLNQTYFLFQKNNKLKKNVHLFRDFLGVYPPLKRSVCALNNSKLNLLLSAYLAWTGVGIMPWFYIFFFNQK